MKPAIRNDKSSNVGGLVEWRFGQLCLPEKYKIKER